MTTSWPRLDVHTALKLWSLDSYPRCENNSPISWASCLPHSNIFSLQSALAVTSKIAWQDIPDYSEVISQINLNNSIQLLDVSVEETNCKKIIVAGSCFEYGKNKGVCKESDPVQLKSFFSWAKYSLYQYLLLKCNQREVELIWFRIFYVYGPGQRGGSLVPMLFERIKKRIIPEIRYPFNKNDFIYVGDVAEAFLQAVSKSLPSGIYNIGSGQSTRVIDICKIIEKNILSGTEITERIRKNIKHEQKESFWADISKSQKLLGWKYKTTLEDGIAKYDELEGRI